MRGGGARVPHPSGMGAPSVRGCCRCGDRGHVQRFCPTRTGGGSYGGVAGRCWGCGGHDHRISMCPGRTLPVARPDGTFPPVMNGGAVKRGGGTLGAAPFGKGGAVWGGSILGYVGGSRALSGSAPLGAR